MCLCQHGLTAHTARPRAPTELKEAAKRLLNTGNFFARPSASRSQQAAQHDNRTKDIQEPNNNYLNLYTLTPGGKGGT